MKTSILAIAFIALICGCTAPHCDTIKLKNKIVDCADAQVFWVVSNHPSTSRGASIVLLEFADSIREKNYPIFFPAVHSRRYDAEVQGCFKAKLKETSYGCIGASVFMVEKVISIKDVSSSETFPIYNPAFNNDVER